MKLRLILLLFFVCTLSLNAQRTTYSLNDNWSFRFSHDVDNSETRRVDLPHTWNAQDALAGERNYKRGIGNYTKKLFIRKEWQGKRLYLKFYGANSIATIFLNGKFVSEHKGGYSAFAVEITKMVEYGQENNIEVRVNNGERLDVAPLVGDFNFYGGLYRDVELIVASSTSVSLLNYGSPGIFLTQKKVTPKEAEMIQTISLSNGTGKVTTIRVVVEVKHAERSILTQEKEVTLLAQENKNIDLNYKIKQPHLWDGINDPFMYEVITRLVEKGQTIDQVIQPLGLRYYETKPDEGFFLNGKHLALHGVCRHQDRPEIGNALHDFHHKEDVDIMLDMGVNATRLAHYQQAEKMYDLMDEKGIITWAEIPFVGPGGYKDKGFVNSPEFKQNLQQQLRELIRQNYNHPSICFWGLFNELKYQGDDPTSFVEELNVLAHQEDSTRPTVAASNQSGPINNITDNIAWNRYDGWYGGMPENLGVFLDNKHKNFPHLRIGISEYGAGASIYHHQEENKKPTANSFFHPEEWQTFYHMENWKVIASRPYVWGSFVWNMFDFGAAHRHEGDRKGVNDKGLVSFDRTNKKDAFYFYRVNWNNQVTTFHLCSKDFKIRKNTSQHFILFTSLKEATLFVNGEKISQLQTDNYHTIIWKNIPLKKGYNKVIALNKKAKIKEEMELFIQQ